MTLVIPGIEGLAERRRPYLREMLRTGARLRAIEFHNPISAMIGEAARATCDGRTVQFDLLWASGFSNATAMGLPDAELALLERRLDTLADTIAVTNKPIIADVDTGRDPLYLGTLCARLEGLGVSAVVVEDKCGVKRSSLAESVQHDLEDIDTYVAKLQTAKAMLRTPDMVFFARTESLIAGLGVQEALRRAQRYLAQAADGLVIHSKDKSGDEIREFLRGYAALCQDTGLFKPVVCIPTAYNHVTDTELFSLGATLVIHANHMIRAAFKAMTRAAGLILESDRSHETNDICAPVAALFDAVGTGDAPVFPSRSATR
jgi:2-methylisocitrate lyase-like PEP mutase family enzyme